LNKNKKKKIRPKVKPNNQFIIFCVNIFGLHHKFIIYGIYGLNNITSDKNNMFNNSFRFFILVLFCRTVEREIFEGYDMTCMTILMEKDDFWSTFYGTK
jgi:hypothetical protein